MGVFILYCARLNLHICIYEKWFCIYISFIKSILLFFRYSANVTDRSCTNSIQIRIIAQSPKSWGNGKKINRNTIWRVTKSNCFFGGKKWKTYSWNNIAKQICNLFIGYYVRTSSMIAIDFWEEMKNLLWYNGQTDLQCFHRTVYSSVIFNCVCVSKIVR